MQRTGANEEALGPVAIGKLCHVAPETVYRWIQEGKLPAFKTGGGHSRVFRKDVEVFLKKLNLPSSEDPSVAPVILVVDDDAEVRKLVARVLRDSVRGARVVEAGDGFEAGRQTILVKPDLVILDIRLPGLDGFRVCRAIRSDGELKSTRILAISGDHAPEVREGILAEGADDFLEKPIMDLSLFKAKVRALLKR